MPIAIHGVDAHGVSAQCFTSSEALCSLLYKNFRLCSLL